jgi:PAS domain S-box-containing protein
MQKILVIDDEEAFRKPIANALRAKGYDTAEAGSGEAGLQTARAFVPDLILSDVNMEGMDAYDLLARLRDDSTTATIPVILMTGQADEAGMRRGMDLGADDYLPKPFTISAMMSAVDARFKKQLALRQEAEQTKARLLAILEATPDLVGMADAKDHRVLFLNKAGRKISGLTLAEDISRFKISDFHPPWAMERVTQEGIPTAIRDGVWAGETAFLARDGREVPVAQLILSHKAPDGTVEFFSTVARDITEAKQLERRRQARYAVGQLVGEAVSVEVAAPRILEALSIGLDWDWSAFWTVDATANALRLVCRWHSPEAPFSELDTMSGSLTFAPGAGLPGNAWQAGRAVWVPDLTQVCSCPRASAALGSGLRSGAAFPLCLGTKVLGVMEFFGKAIRPEEESARQLMGEAGSAIGQFIERKRTEEALRKSEELFRLITENAADLIAVVDAQGRRLYNSPSYGRILGYTADELQATTAFDQLHPDDRDRVIAASAETFRTGQGQVLEYRMRHKDGSWRHFESHGAIIRGANGGVDRLLVVARDVTERKKAEHERALMQVQLNQAQKLESIGQLAAGIAHEINTPTQYIGDNTRFLQDAFADFGKLLAEYDHLLRAAKENAVTPEVVARVEKTTQEVDAGYLRGEIPKAIKQSLEGVDRVAKIVRAMKEFSHPGAEEKTMVDLNRAIESTVTVARNEWKYVSDLVLLLEPSLPAVPCLPGEFNQVILNLIINATHAIQDVVGDGSKGKGTITVSTRRDGEWVEVRIKDTGKGIPEKVRNRIFEPFFTTKPVGKGTGQGLAIARSVIADKHGGTIHFETEAGKGTTFIIRLPITPPPAAKSKGTR